MKANRTTYLKPFYRWPTLYVLFLSVLGIWLLPYWAMDAARVESVYSHGWWPQWSRLWAFLLDWIPFSVGDVGYISLLIFLFWISFRILQSMVRRQFRKSAYHGVHLIAVLSVLYLFFQVSWGLHYFRFPLMQQVSYPSVPLHLSNVVEVLEYHLEKATFYRDAAVTQNAQLNIDAIAKEADRLAISDTAFDGLLVGNHARMKPSLFGKLASYLGVSGYFNPFTQEAQFNVHQPKTTLSFTACHELAHQMGVGFEDEANLIGYVLATSSDQPSFQYAAHFSVFWMLMNELYAHSPSLYFKYLEALPVGIRDDTNDLQAYWSAHTGWLQTLSTYFYSWFLKANQQPEGMDRYNRMVDLLLSRHFQHTPCQVVIPTLGD
jgi:hypothetical protein